MKILWKLFYLFFANAVALWLADVFVQGFKISHNLYNFVEIVIVFILINSLIKPILKMMLSPLIVLTLGLGVIVLNSVILYSLTWIFPGIQITGLYSLIYATLIIGITNIILHIIFKRFNRK